MRARVQWSSRMKGAAALAVCLLPLVVLLPGAGSRGQSALLPVGTALAAIGLGWLGETGRGLWLASAGLILTVSELSLIETRPTWAQTAAIAAPPLVAGLATAAFLTRIPSFLSALGGLLAGPARLIFYDPFRDPECTGCFRQAVLLYPDPALAALLGWVGAGLIVLALALALGIRRSPHRVLLTLAVVTVLAAAPGWAGMPTEWPSLVLIALVTIAAALEIGHVISQRRHLARLAEALRAGGRAEQTLRILLADPDLRVDYRRPEDQPGSAAFVDADGAPSKASSTRVVTEVRGPGGVIARIHNDPARGPVDALIQGLSPEVRLGLEQEQMSAVLANQARELAESRERLVRRGDAERRALERDLHDGAQQHLLALGFDLQVALASPTLSGNDRAALEQCRTEARAALDDLRDLSHGLYPPLLSTSGLLPALSALARTTPVEVVVDGDWTVRPPLEVERACYLVVADLAKRSTFRLQVSGSHSTGAEPSFRMKVMGSSCAPDRVLKQRVAALGGQVRQYAEGSNGTTLEVVLPCA